jgi:hypothetical protein
MKVERGPAALDRFKNIVFQTIYLVARKPGLFFLDG